MDIQTVALFGASGKIGRHVVPLLQERGIRVRALVHRTPLAVSADFITGSVTDPAAVREVVRGADAVVQMATTKEDPDTFFDVSVRGTLNVLEACREEGVQQFLLVGGDAAQGIWFYPHPIPIDENHPKMAYPGYYAFSKVLEEVMAEQYAFQYGVPVSILRSSWVFEKGDLLNHFSLLKNVNPAEPGHGFGKVSDEVLALVKVGQEHVPILTDTAGVPYRRHIVHVDDVMQAFGLMLGNPAAVGTSFNVAGPAAFDYRVAANYLSEKSGIPTLEIVCPGYHSFEINISRARSLLGYAPKNNIFTMIDRALREGT
jgi:nucleoside-diphosphate-sugar epimerase